MCSLYEPPKELKAKLTRQKKKRKDFKKVPSTNQLSD